MASGAAHTDPTPPPVQAARPATPRKASRHEQLIGAQLDRTGRQVKIIDVGGAVLALFAGVLAWLLVMVLVDHWLMPLGALGRWLAFLVLVAGSIWWIAARVVPLVLRKVNPLYAAQSIEQVQPSLKNSLINFLMLRQQGNLRPVVMQGIEAQAATGLQSAPVDTAVDHSRMIRFAILLTSLMVVGCAYLFISPKSPLATFARVVAPWSDIAPPSRVQITKIAPGRDATVFLGQPLEISAEIYGMREDEAVQVVYSTVDQSLLDAQTPMLFSDEDLRWHAELPPSGGVQQEMIYHIEAGDAHSRDFLIAVEQAPTIVVDRVEYRPPAYTGRSLRTAQSEGDLSGLEGTEVIIRAVANRDMETAYVQFDPPSAGSEVSGQALSSGQQVRMQVDGRQATGRFILRLTADRRTPWHTSYRLHFTPNGKSQQAVRHTIEVLPDLPPEIEILYPEQREVTVPADGALEFEVRAIDPDFGLTRAWLTLDAHGQLVREVPLWEPPSTEGVTQIVETWRLIPAEHQLKEGDVANIVAHAADNRHSSTNATTLEPSENRTPNYRVIIGPAAQGGSSDSADSQSESSEEQSGGEGGAQGEEQQQEGAGGAGDENDQGESQSEQGTGQDSATDDQQQPEESAEGEGGDSSSEQSGAGDSQEPGGQDDSQQPGGEGGAGEQGGSGDSDSSQQGGAGGEGDASSQGGTSSEPVAGEGADGEAMERIAQHLRAQQDSSSTGSESSESENDQSQGSRTQQSSSSGSSSQGADAADRLEDIADRLDQAQGEQETPPAPGSPEAQQRDQQLEQLEGELENLKDQVGNGQGGEDAQRARDALERIKDHVSDQAGSGAGDHQPTPQERELLEKLDELQQALDEQAEAQEQAEGDNSQGEEQHPGGQPQQTPATDQQSQSSGSQGPGAESQPSRDDGPGQGSEQGSSSEEGTQAAGPTSPSGADPAAGEEGEGEAPQDSVGSEGASQPRDQQGSESQPNSDESEDGASSNSVSDHGSDSQGDQDGSHSGSGGEGGGQQSDQAGTDSAGSNTPGEEGAGAASELGEGPTGLHAGSQQESGDPTGHEGSDQGEGSSSQTGTGQQPGAGDQPSGAEQSPENPSQQPSGDQGELPQQEPGGESGSPPQESPQGQSDSETGGGQQSSGGGNGSTSQGPPPRAEEDDFEIEASAEEANLEYAREVTDLVLDYLRDQEHDPDEALLEDLGWTPEQLRQFVDRVEQMRDNAAQSEAGQREFEDYLSSLGLAPPEARTRSAPQREEQYDGQGDIGTHSTAPSSYYQRLMDVYSRGVQHDEDR